MMRAANCRHANGREEDDNNAPTSAPRDLRVPESQEQDDIEGSLDFPVEIDRNYFEISQRIHGIHSNDQEDNAVNNSDFVEHSHKTGIYI
jgi:hypothetical protein